MEKQALDRHRDSVLRERVRMLYSAIPLSQGIAFAVAVILFAFQESQGQHNAHGWFALISGVLALRGFSAVHYFGKGSVVLSDRAWLTAFRLGAIAAGACWGGAALLFIPDHDVTLQVFTILTLAGVAAGAISSMAADHGAYRFFVLLIMGPVSAVALMQGQQPQITFGLLSLLLLIFLDRSSHSYAKSLTHLLTLRFENATLITDLEREKKRVIDEAETMMGRILGSAPIAIWAVDAEGVVSFVEGGQGSNLEGLRLPPIGESVLADTEDRAQIAYQTRRALNGESFVAELDAERHCYEVNYGPLFDEDGNRQGAIGVAVDISERKRHEKELARLAHYDQLTGLPNRVTIMNQLEHAFEHARRNDRLVAVYFIDLDNFKAVNDTMGHKAGDTLLHQAADRLRASLRESDMPARLGGDEFLAVSEGLQRPSDAEVIAHKIVGVFQQPFTIDSREFYATASIGIAVFPQDGATAEQLLQSADTAMYHAKFAGKNKYRFFTSAMQATAERHLEMETELRRALDRGELFLEYQPKIDVMTRTISGAEALLRWNSPSLGRIGPDEFIPVAELAGVMPHIGDWVLRTACREAVAWQRLVRRPLHVAINVSPQQFRNTDLLANVTQALVESGLPAAQLELEITESVLVQDTPEAMRVFNALVDLGVTLSLDDFGTGYSSLSYLKKFPMRVLKIDKAFVRDLGKRGNDESLVDAIIAMAHSLRMQVVAEGVETEAQFAYLQQRGVEMVQGYYFSRPVSAGAFQEMIGIQEGDAPVTARITKDRRSAGLVGAAESVD
ncbi:MAG: EAL domain-containing protein [Gammaproteobacteria bacterium]|nr:EAL domain-containing protein [Gammaproteobacteria bacterium]